MKDAAQIRLLNLVNTSLNLLLNLVSDMVDLTLIKRDRYLAQKKLFNPTEALQFVHSIMTFQANSQKL